VATFLVDRDLPGASLADLAAAQHAAIEASEAAAAAGTPVRYLRSVFVPGEAHCMCLFEGPDAASVRKVNDAAMLPYRRVTPAWDLPHP